MAKKTQKLTHKINRNPPKIKYFLILIALLLGITLISAQMEFDNIKSFDKNVGEYGKVIIKDWFGLLDLTELELKNNTNICGTECSADIEIIMHQKGRLIDDIKFMLQRKDETWKRGNIKEYQIYVNGKVYKLGEEVKAGTYFVKLEGKKNPFHTVDWQITSQGMLLDEWATWGGSLNTNILAYYDFEEGTGTTTEDQISGKYNGTLVDFEAGDWVGGKLGSYALSFDGTNNYVNLSILPDGWDNISFSYWFKTDDLSINDDYMLDMRNPAGGSPNIFFYSGIANKASFYGGTNLNSDAGNLDDDAWHHLVGTINDTGGVSLYVDGEINTTGTGGYSSFNTDLVILGNALPLGEGLWYDGEIDELAIWNKTLIASEVSDLYNDGAGLAYQGFGVTLDSPSDNSEEASSEIEFNCSVAGASSLVNMSLYHNETGTWSLNQTVDVTGSSNSTNFTSTITSSAIWNCEACDSSGCIFADSNYTIITDIESPVINITYPILNIKYGKEGKIIYINWTASDNRNLETCIYTYNGTNTTIPSCLDLNATFIINASANNITFFTNDTAGNIATANSTWGYKVFEESQVFNTKTTEGAKESFEFNFTKASSRQISTVDLVYNGTSYSLPYSVSGNNVTALGSITIPAKNLSTNVTFFWSILLDDNTEVNTSLNNQSLFNLNVDNCTSYTKLIYNFTQYDEGNKSKLTSNDMEVQMNLYDISKSLLLINFSQRFTNVNPTQICLEESVLPNVNYSSYVTVKYWANFTTANESYSKEYYNILNETIGNGTIPKNKGLYNLKKADTTKFRLTFRDDEFVLAPNVLVQVHRQYLEDNEFKIVEIPLTDSNGQTMVNLVRNDVVYNFIMVNEGRSIIATFNNLKAFCQDFTIGDCTIDLNAKSQGELTFDYDSNFGISVTTPTYDNSTQLISLTFITDDALPKTVNMNVFRNNDFGNRSVCSSSLTSASGTLSCDASSVIDSDQFLFIHVYVDNEQFSQYTIILNAEAIRFGVINGAFYAFLLILLLVCLFMEDKKVLLISLVLGWGVIISLGLINGALIGVASAGIWILVSVAIFLWKLNKEESIG